jgi:hypothetical protein
MKVHEAVCRFASTAEQVTGVDPIGYVTPLGGEQVIVTGEVPPLAIGEA